jgi:hypothetical protein
MNRSIRWLLVLLVVAGAGFGIWYNLPSEEKRIRKTIEGMARDATFTGGEGNLSRLAKVESLSSRFAVDAELHVDQVLPVESALSGRDAIKGLMMAAAPHLGAVDVQVHDVRVTLGGEGEARVSMTASAKTGGKRGDFTAQEFELKMVRVEGKWLVRRLEAVAGFRKADGR